MHKSTNLCSQANQKSEIKKQKTTQNTIVTFTLLNLVHLHPILNKRDAIFHGELVAALRLKTLFLYDNTTNIVLL